MASIATQTPLPPPPPPLPLPGTLPTPQAPPALLLEGEIPSSQTNELLNIYKKEYLQQYGRQLGLKKVSTLTKSNLVNMIIDTSRTTKESVQEIDISQAPDEIRVEDS